MKVEWNFSSVFDLFFVILFAVLSVLNFYIGRIEVGGLQLLFSFTALRNFLFWSGLPENLKDDHLANISNWRSND